MTIKRNALAEACLWLPGFAPDEDPIATLGTVCEPSCSLTLAEPAPAEPPRPVWPRLMPEHLEGIRSPVARFEANVAAIRLLRQLQEEKRPPSDEERIILNRYTGWGSIPNAFDPWHLEWRERNKLLLELLTSEEYESARLSTPNAHYTPIEIVEAIWAMLRRLGFKGGRVLEPSCGVGYFIGAMPTELAQASRITGIELDRVSARIAQALYEPFGATIYQKGFESLEGVEGYFDVVVSNVPFGNYGVAELRNVPYAKYSIHNYFIAKALDVVRPGGLVAVITSAFTMDAFDSSARRHFEKQAALVAAMRLPATALKAVADTEVTTDVLIFQRKTLGQRASLRDWRDTVAVPGQDDSFAPVQANRYFVENPEWVLGTLSVESGPYGKRMVCVAEGDLAASLQQRVAALPEGVYRDHDEDRGVRLSLTDAHRAGYRLIDGKVFEVVGNEGVAVADGKKARRIAAMIQLRDVARRVVEGQANPDTPDTRLDVLRVELNAVYDAFVAAHGFIHDAANLRAFRKDPDLPLLLSLEQWDEEAQTASKADIFYRRTVQVATPVTSVSTVEDALAVCLSEQARIVPERIGQLLGKDADAAMADLQAAGLAFVDPQRSAWVPADEYLSGNVKEKLAVAKVAGPEFAANVAALEAVQPVDLRPEEITVRIGAPWIPADVYEQFINGLLNAGEIRVRFDNATGSWDVSTTRTYKYNLLATQTWGTFKVDALRLFRQALNQQAPRVTRKTSDGRQVVDKAETIAAREKQEKIREEFVRWIWSDKERADRLAGLYNAIHNCLVPRRFNGEHLKLPGLSSVYTLWPHQRDAIWRIIASGKNTLLAHVVGAGKTLTMICAAMELRRLGRAHKPMMVVPNHMLEQVAREFLAAYPGAKVLMASKDELEGDRRRVLLNRIATGDWDAVVITHASFERIKMSDEYLVEYIEEELEQIRAALEEARKEKRDRRSTIKELAKAERAWEARLKRLSGADRKDDILTFDQLGIDWLFVDEAHLFKNLWRFSKMERVAGLPNSNSERAFDMFVKTRYLMQRRGEHQGVVFATGTPVANSMAELWVMQRYLQPQTLERFNLEMFDAWAASFGEVVNAIELAPDGSGYRVNNRFARFVNLPELMGMFQEVADIRTREMLNLPVPAARFETVTAKPSESLKAFVEELVARAEAIRAGEVQPWQDNMLAVTTDGRKAALDMRLVGVGSDDPGSKVNLCVDQIHRIWLDTAADRGTQLVFCDMGTPSAGRWWSVYDDIRSKLVARGVPEHEIAFIHDYESDMAKATLFKAVRDGRVRVLLGSTSKMGVGTNVQKRLVALHHLDAPWRPADVEQREGRIIRQGNRNQEVRIIRYVTEGSFDAYIWQTLETKAKFIAQVMQGDSGMRTAEDLEMAALSYAEVKALASGNPLVIEKAAVDSELAKLTLLKAQYDRQRTMNQWEVASLGESARKAREAAAAIAEDIRTRDAQSAQPLEVTIAGQVFTRATQEEAARSIRRMVKALMPGSERAVGDFRGFRLVIAQTRSGDRELWLCGRQRYEVPMNVPFARQIEVLAETLAELESRATARLERASAIERRIQDLQDAIRRPFEKAERLEWLRRRQYEINLALGLVEDDPQAAVEEDESELALAA